jgi:hypothetical protein
MEPIRGAIAEFDERRRFLRQVSAGGQINDYHPGRIDAVQSCGKNLVQVRPVCPETHDQQVAIQQMHIEPLSAPRDARSDRLGSQLTSGPDHVAQITRTAPVQLQEGGDPWRLRCKIMTVDTNADLAVLVLASCLDQGINVRRYGCL